MDLTKNFPRSPKEKLAGVVMLARTSDKARAYNAGKLGEYKYDCPLDQEVFEFLNIDHGEFARRADELSEPQLEEWVRVTFVSKKSAADIDKFNASFLGDKPEPESDSEKRFLAMRAKIDPSRTDVTTWVDLLDLEEGRDVPRRAAA